MYIRARYAGALLPIMLCGCGVSLPELTPQQVLPTDVLIQAIDCEFRDAVWHEIEDNGLTFLQSWQGQYTVTLKGNETGSLKGSSAIPIALSRGSTLGLGLGAGTTTTANRTAIMKFNLDFQDVQGPCRPTERGYAHPFLQGKIGFKEWMDRALNGALADKDIRKNPAKKIVSIAHTFEFSLEMNANASPVFTIAPSPVLFTPTGTIDRLDDNIVDVTLAKPADGGTVQKKVLKTDKVAQRAKEVENLRTATADFETSSSLLRTDPQLKEAQAVQERIDAAQPSGPGPRPEAQQLRTENSQALSRLDSVKSAITTSQAKIASSTAAIKQIDTDPANFKTVNVRTAAPPGENPNISNTQLQLTLERLITNSRLTGF